MLCQKNMRTGKPYAMRSLQDRFHFNANVCCRTMKTQVFDKSSVTHIKVAVSELQLCIPIHTITPDSHHQVLLNLITRHFFAKLFVVQLLNEFSDLSKNPQLPIGISTQSTFILNQYRFKACSIQSRVNFFGSSRKVEDTE